MKGKTRMHDKIALVTGANAGIGKVIATELARQGATVVIVSRDRQRGEEAMREIVSATGNTSLDLLVADLSSQQAVRQLADEFQQRYSHLHVLVNNAGAHVRQRQVSVDGIEMNLAINHLSAFLLTNLLLDTMRASTPGRIVNVASNAMTRTINLDDLQSEKTFVPFDVYGQAKLAMVMCGYSLARRLTGTGITVNALHPGITATNIVNKAAPPIARPFIGLIKLFLQSPEQGARTALYLATSPKVEGVTGKYFVDGKPGRSVPISYDEALQERVWNISEELVGLEHSVLQRF
jgi:NAD(P)-dependent dehydrogenase (short-subunit alcohol dehydrogenase family)